LALALIGASWTAAFAFDNFRASVAAPRRPKSRLGHRRAPRLQGPAQGQRQRRAGEELFEEKCASCHGTFGESNEVSPADRRHDQGRHQDRPRQGLSSGELPQRTTFTKVATISTVFDYINRAMPWTAPKSLKPDEVTPPGLPAQPAEMVPADFVLSDKNIAEVQKLPQPQRHDHRPRLWPGASAKKGGIGNGGKPDVKNTACMRTASRR
jgi:cytochrome c